MAHSQKVKLGGRLYSDSLGTVASGADTLAKALIANAETIAVGLSEGH